MQIFDLELKQDEVLCREGDVETGLFLVLEGELIVFVRKASQVIAIAKIGKGEYVGELSFFDNRPRGADIVALTNTKLLKIPSVEIRQSFPQWLSTVGKAMAQKLRLYDEVIRSRGIKKSNVDTIKPLSMEEQRFYFNLLSK
jgi:CRP/FNR family cyclic AMP-dependent transcriptional regulator